MNLMEKQIKENENIRKRAAISIDETIRVLEEEEANFTIWDKIDIAYHRTFGIIHDFFAYELVQGLKNFWRFKAVIWRHRWYDYSFSDSVTEECYRIMAENWHKNHYVGGDKDERELKHIVALFEKMTNTETFTVEGDEEDDVRKELYRLISRKRYWD